MARLLIVSRSMALAMRLADEHEVAEHSADDLAGVGPEVDADVLVLDLGDPVRAVDAVNTLREKGAVVPVLLVSGYQPAWEYVQSQDVEGVRVVPLPITRTALLDGVQALLGDPVDEQDPAVAAPGDAEPGTAEPDGIESDGTAPDAAAPDDADADGSQPDDADADGTEPDIDTPGGTEPDEEDTGGDVGGPGAGADGEGPVVLPWEPVQAPARPAGPSWWSRGARRAERSGPGGAEQPPGGTGSSPTPGRGLGGLRSRLGDRSPVPDAEPDGGLTGPANPPDPPDPTDPTELEPLEPPDPVEGPLDAGTSLDQRLDQDAEMLLRGAVIRDANGVAFRLADLVQVLNEHAGSLYGVADTAQVLADDVVERADADAAAVLVPDGPTWRVSAGVGLRPLERRLVLQEEHWLIGEIGLGGRAVMIEDTDVVRQELSGAPLAAWRHVLAVPVPDVQAIVVLARGREGGPFDDHDLSAVIGPVREAAPLLAQAVEIRRLARLLGPLRELEPEAGRRQT